MLVVLFLSLHIFLWEKEWKGEGEKRPISILSKTILKRGGGFRTKCYGRTKYYLNETAKFI